MSETDDLSAPELRSILAAVPGVVAVIGKDGSFRFLSRSEEGYNPDELIGEPAADFVQPDFRDSFVEILEGVFATGEPAEYEIAVSDAQGEEQWHMGTVTPLMEDGRVDSVVVVTTNVTERHRAREEAEKLRSLIPVCSWCKKVRDDQGFWGELEDYIEDLGESRVTHSMCPDCQAKMLNAGESA